MRLNAVPQFQGAVTKRAQEMPDGCIALATLASRILDVPFNKVPQDRATSPTEAGVANRAILTGPNLEAQRAAVAGIEEPILTIGGDCGVEFEPIRVLRERYGTGLGVAWFDAHPDLKTPEDSNNGAYHAMVLAGLLGKGDPALTASQTVDPKKVALIDARAAVTAERAAIDRGMGITTLEPATVLSGASHVYVHIDVDVLDPSEFDGHNMPEPNGLTIPQLLASLDSLREFNVVGAGITECVGTAAQVAVLAPVIAKLGELLQPTTA
ncbi:MAG: arginase family protein [Aquihabitans sp.]